MCAAIIGIGYCGMYLEKIAAKDKAKGSTGVSFFILMFLLAAIIFGFSLMQGRGLSELLG